MILFFAFPFIVFYSILLIIKAIKINSVKEIILGVIIFFVMLIFAFNYIFNSNSGYSILYLEILNLFVITLIYFMKFSKLEYFKKSRLKYNVRFNAWIGITIFFYLIILCMYALSGLSNFIG
jgi:hypothetical protein